MAHPSTEEKVEPFSSRSAFSRAKAFFFHCRIYVQLLGCLCFFGAIFTPGQKKTSEDNSNTTTAESTADAESTQSRQPIHRRVLSFTNINRAPKPTSFWAPLIGTTVIVFYAFKTVRDTHIEFPGVHQYYASCPTNERRTQTGAFVKLFAATVTTIAVNGHYGSLAGSESWRRELARGLEVIVSPLTILFHFAASLYYELASVAPEQRRVWHDEVSVRHRLARLCSCRISSPDAKSAGPYLGVTSPAHVDMVLQPRNLKWYGRMMLLTIFVAQYFQAALLITRRLLSQTSAAVDVLTLCMILSGSVALFQSITITLINAKWVISPTFQPCDEKHCRLPECRSHKSEQGLENATINFTMFGLTFSSGPRHVLHLLAGGHLQLMLMLREERGLASILMALFGLKVFWSSTIWFSAMLDGGLQLIRGPAESGPENSSTQSNEATAVNENSEDSSTQPNGTTEVDESSESSIVGALAPTVFFVAGLGYILFMLVCIFAQLFYLFCPFIFAVIQIIEETNCWKGWAASEPCPQLWKYGMEDMLWSF